MGHSRLGWLSLVVVLAGTVLVPAGLRGDMRVGLALEGGKVDGRYTETNLNGWQSSVTAYVGGETPIGMVYLGYGYAPNGMGNFYLFIGQP